jgi:hypothetical protein
MIDLILTQTRRVGAVIGQRMAALNQRHLSGYLQNRPSRRNVA